MNNFFSGAISALFISLLTNNVNAQIMTPLLTEQELYKATPYTSLEEALKAPNMVYILDLYDKGLTKLPKEILKLNRLQWLILGKNDFSQFPEEVFGLTNLQILDASNSNITELPKEIKKLKHLKQLALGFNKISMIPKELYELSELKSLTLKNNLIVSLPKNIAGLKSLEVLDIALNPISKLPKDIGELPQLSRLDAHWLSPSDRELFMIYGEMQALQTLPESLFKLSNLKALDISGSDVSRFPKEIRELNLEKLNISRTKISEQEIERIKKALPKTDILAIPN